ncbi:alpha/beta hydrolase [Brevibacillus sp. GCM10020057]|uniref:alpha/beta hydrolase n=1 Tax=Brevibacillus sp. GCM10020057 TaxID=3317327 RepID=UPI003636FF7B
MLQTIAEQAVGHNGQPVRYTRIQPSASRSRAICFFCPGASYLFDKPYLYYATMLLLGRSVDLVHIEYTCVRDNTAFSKLTMAERSRWLQEDVNAVVENVLAEHPYEQILFLGKSIGTMPIVDGLLPNPLYEKASAILLTPILTSEQLATNLLAAEQSVFLAIGTGDPFYQKDLIERLETTKPNLRLCVVPNANHALEIGWDVRSSIAALEQVMGKLEGFVSPLLPAESK